MEQYNVTGMSCAACSTRIEKAVSKVPGVKNCSVSLLTNSMGVEGNASADEIIKAVTDAGYGASLKSFPAESKTSVSKQDQLKDTETPVIRKRLISSLILLLPLLYVSMGHTMWNWPLPPFFHQNPLATGILQLLLSAIIMVINQKFFISGFKGLIHGAPNMDTLVALGSGASFIYSLYALFAMSSFVSSGNNNQAMKYLHEFYFESAAMILTLITIGKLLEAKSKGRTTDALKGLMNLAPKTAILVKDNKEIEVPVEEIQPGDLFSVRPGQSIPVDGIIIDGNSAVNEASLTGESIPVDKNPGDKVSAATINQSGYMLCRATRVGQDTTLSQIIQLVSDAAATKAPVAKVADKVSGFFVPAVIFIALVTFAVWMFAGQTFGYALARAISVLVISCPCALGLATPVAIMVGNGIGARNGILFKTAASMEECGKTQIVVLDKTGTITKGQPQVRNILPENNYSEKEVLELAASLELKSEHPLAKSIVEKARADGISIVSPEDFNSISGKGITGKRKGKNLAAGKYDFIKSIAPISSQTKEKAEALEKEGMTVLYFVEEGRLAGIISLADVIKDDSALAIGQLKNMGIHTIMLTGDNERTAAAIGKEAGVDEVAANLLPDEKEKIVKELMEKGNVLMAGDGINDAPALTRANTGAAIGAGTDIAIDAADLVLMKSSLLDLAAAIRLSRKTLRNIHENLFWAFFYNVIGIPLAAGAYIKLFGWELNPMFGAAAMSLSSFCVVTNALRLNFFNIFRNRRDKKIKHSLNGETLLAEREKSISQEEKNMTIKVKGMMCQHCEKHVKDAIEKLENVVSAAASHETGTVEIQTSGEVSKESLKQAVTEAGYEFVE